ncbi:MAG: hypothetical protein WC346_09910 [Methanogenium sp.]|jgi:hypothetical protein
MMKTIIPIFCVLSLLVIGSGCTGFKDSPVNISANETPAIILHYENENISVPVNVSQIEVRDPYYFTKNITSVIAILFNDPRTGILLANGWNISSVVGATDEHDPNRTHTKVEFEKEGLSFFIGVDETANRTLEGRCGAKQWVTEPISGPLPEDYHQWKYYDEDSTMMYYVIDHKNERIVMLYNKTTIFFLYPSYATINFEGLND